MFLNEMCIKIDASFKYLNIKQLFTKLKGEQTLPADNKVGKMGADSSSVTCDWNNIWN